MKQKWLLERMDKRIQERVIPVSEAELESPQLTLKRFQQMPPACEQSQAQQAILRNVRKTGMWPTPAL